MKKQIGKQISASSSARKPAAKKATIQSKAMGKSLADKVKAGVDCLSTAVILIDRDFVVTYANQASREMLSRYANEFRTIFPSFDASKIVGSPVEVFYTIPSHQRLLLVDPKNLPYRAEWSVGALIFSFCINASLDSDGKYIGNMIEWMEITEQHKKETLNADFASQIGAINRSSAIIEFDMQGIILSANQNFLNAMGYALDEIQGKHHSLFVDEAFKKSDEYRDFWANLQRGTFQAAEYKRFGKHGREVWIQASYNPIFDKAGKPIKVVKFATDVTAAKLQSAEYSGQINAIGRTMAVIDFNMDGTIISANKHFLDATGYSLEEIKGRHHGIFVDQAFRASDEYREFWAKLNRGEAERKQYKRIRKNGSELWLEASYNPIFDLNGKPYKIVKFATDITASKQHEEQLARAMAETRRVMQAIGAGNLSETMQGSFEGEFAELQASVNTCVDYLKRIMSETSRVMSGVASGDFRSSMEGSFAGVFGEVRDSVNGCVDYLKRMISETDRVMRAVASGDLRDSMEGNFEGSFGELRDAVNSSVARLKETVEQIRNAMSTMTVSATEIASGNLDLSQRTEEQAASLATTAANMEQITATVKQNADSARAANSLATSAQQHAERGGSVVSNAIAAMGSINEASKRIADIIGVIDDIAFQTNLLALNAAVEAARAGEQGRGFAVVASEVRNLAQRSAGAAKEIKGLIKDSVGRVEEGSRLVNESGSTLEQIVTAAKKVADIVAEIAAASAEQSLGIEKVTEAIQQMDVAVQQNAALVEETSAASSMMDEQTRGMSTMVEYFKLSDNDEAFSALQRREPPVKQHFGNARAVPPRSTARKPLVLASAGGAKQSKHFGHADEF